MGPNDPVTHAELRAAEERIDGQFELLNTKLNDIEQAVNRAPEITNTAIVQSQTQLEGKIALSQSQTETKIAQSRNAQTLWTVGTLLVLAPILISVTGWMIVNLK